MRKSLSLLITAAMLTPVSAAADTVGDWMDFTNSIQSAATGPAAGSTRPDVVRANTRVAIAMFEALNAIDRRYESIAGLAPVTTPASREAAVITAANGVLIDHFPQKKALIDESFAIAISAVAPGAERTAGEVLGKAAADAANKLGGIDPSAPTTPYRPFTRPGQWVPTALPSVDSSTLIFKPWALPRTDALRPPPPPAMTSAIWARDYAEVKAVGERASKTRTPLQSLMARYRQAPDMGPALRLAAAAPGRDLLANARMHVLVQMATDDAQTAMADAKIFYDTWRPITAIRNGDDDGNPATEPQADWVPFIPTPNFAEYPCGHCIYAASLAEVMKGETGNMPATGVRVGSLVQRDLIIQVLPSWDEWVQRVSDSRIYGGVHFRFANDTGEAMGRKAAQAVMTRYARPLPAEAKR